MARHTYLCPMRWSDMDAYGHVNNVRFLTYLEEARIDMFNELAELNEHANLVGTGVVVARHEINYKRPLIHRNAPIPIDTWVTDVGGASFDLSYEVHDEDGTVYATAASIMVPYDFQHARPRRLSGLERDYLARFRDESGRDHRVRAH
ncbi:MAG: acyl-CoA thioesterase [Actinomycetales bacterium]